MEKVTIHFHSGSSAVASVDTDDLELEGERVRLAGTAWMNNPDPGGAEELVESAITIPPKPRWVWVGDVYLFTQAVCGFELGDTSS